MSRLAVVAVLICSASSAAAQQPARSDSATVAVIVVDAQSKQPVEDAEVRAAAAAVRTDYMGEARVRHPRGSTIRVTVRHPRYAAIDTAFALGDTDWQLMLAAAPLSATTATQLATTTVTAPSSAMRPELEGFHRRLAQNKGKYLTPDELKKGSDRKLVDMVSKMGGLVVNSTAAGGYKVYARSGPTSFVTSNRESYDRNVKGSYNMGDRDDSEGFKPGHCEVHVFLDGMYSPGIDLDAMRAAGFEGVEYYTPSNVPPEFKRPGTTCGVLLLWSR